MFDSNLFDKHTCYTLIMMTTNIDDGKNQSPYNISIE